MIIAIDGPAASGKGTLGKRLAAHYGLRHLDTGLIYRAVAKAMLDAGHSPGNRARAVAAAEALDPSTFDEAAYSGPSGQLIHCSFHQILSMRLSWQPEFETPTL